MDGALKAKHGNKYNEDRRKRCLKGVMGLSLCIGMMIILFATPIKARLIARINLLVEEIENAITSEYEAPEIDYFKLSSIEVASKDYGMDMFNQYEYIVKTRRDLYNGNLQLINGSHGYLFREMEQLVEVQTNKNKSYKLIDTKMKLNREMLHALNDMMKEFEEATGKHDMIITSGYRTLADQGEVLQEKINLWGEEEALRWAMLPGYSEHHSGYAVDMSIYTDQGNYIKYKGQGEYAWINQNCYKYGFIRRYTEEKKKITGVSDEQWHYRYIGVPHSYVVTAKNFCLEEYMNYLKQFTFDKVHLRVESTNGTYEIYFVPLEGKDISVPVPSNKAYTIFGNNEDGFIVTVTL